MPEQEQTGETPDAADQGILGEALNQDATGEQETGEQTPAAGEQTEEQQGQLAALQAERDKRQSAEARVAALEAQFNLLQQQLHNQSVKQMPQTAKSFFAQNYGLEPDERPTAEMIEAFARQTMQESQLQAQQTSDVAARTAFIQSKADYSDMVGTVNWQGQFQPSDLFVEAMTDDPTLAADLAAGRLYPQAAYRAAQGYKARKELATAKTQQQQTEAQQQAALQTGPLPASAAGGAGAVNQDSQLAGLDMRDPKDRAKILKMANCAEQGEFG
jgi:hypothetical protein